VLPDRDWRRVRWLVLAALGAALAALLLGWLARR